MSICTYCKEKHKLENTGCNNSGKCNSGDRNSGKCNSGNYNSGDRNSGYYNSGYRNSGKCNSGNYNSGDRNSGDCNSGNCNSGWFNTNEPKMRFFNKDSEYTHSEFCEKFSFVYPDLKITAWVSHDKFPKDEQTTDTKNMDGKLKTLTYHEAWAEYWARASEEDKKWFQNLPNFTWEVFTEITGIPAPIIAVTPVAKIDEIININGKNYKRID